MILILVLVLTIWSTHPLCIKFFHPHLSKIRFPWNCNLGKYHRMYFRDSGIFFDWLHESFIQNISSVFWFFFACRIIFNNHIRIHIIWHYGSCFLTVQHGHNTKIHRQTGCQGQQYHRSSFLILCKLLHRKSCYYFPLSCSSYFYGFVGRTITKRFYWRDICCHFCWFSAGQKNSNSNQ